MQQTEIWTNKQDFSNTKVVTSELSELTDGQIRVAIDKFALTANNVSYAVSGNMIGYWDYFPTGDSDWGKVTVWGMADVIESKHPDIQVSERINGFFPMASHLVLSPGKNKANYFVDASEHRQSLPPFYNQYNRCQGEPEIMAQLENERCILFPLYFTGFIISDFLQQNEWFNAEQIIISSASSKTGYALAAFLKQMGYQGRVIGLTSNDNTQFVESLGFIDQTITYDNIQQITQQASVYVDMSGNARLQKSLHQHLGDHMKSSQMVGATHWQSGAKAQALPGAKPEFFFTPKHMAKRISDWGPKAFNQKIFTAGAGLAMQLRGLIDYEYHQGTAEVEAIWQALLNNQVSGKRGIMVSLFDKEAN
ncbi:DUF2855 family protein [Paraferrimonas sp. SM1919]|uniref:DUF2855 family protein n=1 Tax=Paraferrimonas sp. SM1919 TaxID=2662263 RepID=UPI0013D2844E|nr:DUF2855 family protein [Paraferrimonas sp. SM1919]